ncbi:hypothetical protein [Endozoicomonas atrinae]|uniref:hypothetical protein n=1 Tax=Endozoicomonas atrinae TaxID=1333660 RepID=UPI000825D1DE|nr:hypothetical protein [Endozoicomonas atrinae]
MSGVPIVAVKIEYYCFNHSERAPCRRSTRIAPHTLREDAIAEKSSPERSDDELLSEEETHSPQKKTTHRKKTDNTQSQQERIDAVRDIIQACLKKTVKKADIDYTMKLILDRSNHWKDMTSLRTSLKRWFRCLKPHMTEGFEKEDITRAEKIFSRLIGLHKFRPDKLYQSHFLNP